MRGIGIPTTGRIPTTMPRLMNNVEANTKLNPPIVNLQNLSLALKARYKHLNKIKKKIDKTNDKTVKSVNNGIRSSVRKLNPILKSIVGKKVDVAIRDLQFSEKRVTRDVRKTISSAVANAENNFQYDIDKLIIKEAFCGKKIVMKRFRPRAKGRAAPILKPWSTVTIILSEAKQMEKHGTKS